MERTVPLSTGIGEVMAPQTLVTALIVSPDGTVKCDPGALHGRSELESQLEVVPKRELVGDGQSFWIVWVAVELDQANKPMRYKGLSMCELLVNAKQHVAYKSLAEHVNRMGEAIRGGVNLTKLNPETRKYVKQQLVSISAALWEQSADSLRKAFET